MYMFVYVYTHVYTHVCMFLYVSKYVWVCTMQLSPVILLNVKFFNV